MSNEIDSTNIIAAITNDIFELKTVSVKFENIRRVALELEKLKPTLLVSADMMSIDAFRCSFVNYVSFEQNFLVIKNFQDIQWRIQNLLPPKEITDFIHNFYKTIEDE